MPDMETLGLSGPPKPRDSLFRRLFWPSDNASDADMLGQQGFWLCLVIGLFSLVVLSLQGHWIMGIVTFAVFALGGIGVREHDLFAAISVAIIYVANIAGAIVLGRPPGILTLFAALLLLGNIRGCRIAAKWSRLDPESIPTRMNETWQDKLVDQMPARVWPKARYAYYVIAIVFFLLTVAGMVVLIHDAHQTALLIQSYNLRQVDTR